MGRIQLLDCTLRDGGYCNNWNFGKQNICKIITGLEKAGIEIIECGFFVGEKQENENLSKYDSIELIDYNLLFESNNTKYVVMINFGTVSISQIPEYSGGLVKGIRVAFHKQDMEEAIILSDQIIQKGYEVYLQPMVVLDYTDEDFLHLIQLSNKIHPYAFYIVDSFGVIKKKEMIHLYYMADNNLDEDIWIGLHSHNNMQLSYSNAQVLLDIQGSRDIIVDTCIFGMGRGAGNLNTELFAQYLNENSDKGYNIASLLQIYDEILSRFYIEKRWGYSLANYLSAAHNCHPNYATYLDEKNTLLVKDINCIFDMMSEKKKNYFDKKYIEKLYREYMSQHQISDVRIGEFYKIIRDRKILVIAGGKSSTCQKDDILNYIREHDCLLISVNSDYTYYAPDYIFVSNIRRFNQLNKDNKKIIITSNIEYNDAYITITYGDYTNTYDYVEDNAILMLLSFLSKGNIKQIAIAGLDGYSHNPSENYADEDMIINKDTVMLDKINEGISAFLVEFRKNVNVEFVTESKFIHC